MEGFVEAAAMNLESETVVENLSCGWPEEDCFPEDLDLDGR